MAIVMILATFGCMLGLVVTALLACYAAARGMWFSALIAAMLAILAGSGLLKAMDGVEREYERVTAAAQLGGADHD